MASGENSQRQLLMLIRDFSTEKSQGERRVSDLKKRLIELQAHSDSANMDLEKAKRSKETSEQELRGFQVKLDMTDASIIAQEARISLLQEEISKVGSQLANLKNEERDHRDEFIITMYDFNRKIRHFFDTTVHVFQKRHCPDLSSDNGNSFINKGKVLDIQGVIRGLNDKITYTNAQIQILDGGYCKELHDHDEVQQEVASIERRGSLVKAVIQETQELQELSRQTSEWEKVHASLGEELQMRFTCPRCRFNNMGGWEGTSETD